MTRIIKYGILGLTILLANLSCGPTATFERPQPEGLKEEQGFSKNIHGVYQSADSTGTMSIYEKFIIYTYNEKIEQDSDIEDLNHIADTTNLATAKHYTDTIFKINDSYALKKYKGHYFLNKKSSENQKWEVSKLNPDNNILTIASICGEEDINRLNEITKTAKDSSITSTNYDLSKKQFREFLTSNGFRSIDTFRRVNH